MSDANKLDHELNQAILSGKALDAFDKYYAEDVVMQENSEAPRAGKALNRKFEEQFFASIEQFHGAQLIASAVGAEKTFSEWEWDLTFKGGTRAQMRQVAVRQWKDGKVNYERFYYSK